MLSGSLWGGKVIGREGLKHFWLPSPKSIQHYQTLHIFGAEDTSHVIIREGKNS